MRRLGLLVGVAVLLISVGHNAAAAHTVLWARQAGFGTAVTYIGPEGEELGRLTVEDVVEPFRDYDPNSPPDRGSRYVLIQLTVENSGTRALVIDPTTFSIQDSDGFLMAPEPTSVSAGADASTSALVSSELEPGESISGSLIFQVVNAAEPARVLFQPGRDRLIILADLTSTRMAPEATETEDAARPVSTETPPVPPTAAPDRQMGIYAILLVTYNCPPGTTLEEIQVTPCPRAATGFEPVLTGPGGTWTVADLVSEQAGPVWDGMPDGQYALTFTSLPDGHDLYYVYGDGAAPTVDYVGGAGATVTIGPDTVRPAGFLALNVYFVDAKA